MWSAPLSSQWTASTIRVRSFESWIRRMLPNTSRGEEHLGPLTQSSATSASPPRNAPVRPRFQRTLVSNLTLFPVACS